VYDRPLNAPECRDLAAGAPAITHVRVCAKIGVPEGNHKENGMFVVELAFDHTPERMQARPDHRQRLQNLKELGRLLMAGPYADDSGALLVFDVSGLDEMRQLLAEDPYYRTAGVTVVRCTEWTPIVR
jgi:uncharacterized protein